MNPRRIFTKEKFRNLELFDIHFRFKNYEVESLNRISGEVKLM